MLKKRKKKKRMLNVFDNKETGFIIVENVTFM